MWAVCNAERLNELQEGVAKGQALLHRLAQLRRRNGVTISGRLDIGGVGRAVVAEHDRRPGHPFAADQSDLDFLAVALNGDDRGEARLRKIDVLDPLVGLFEHLPQPEGHSLEVRREQIEVAGRKGRKQCVGAE